MTDLGPLGISFPLQIKIVTPLHIGGGESLSPYSDYVLDTEKNVWLMDTDKLSEEVYKTQQTNTFINNVMESAGMEKSKILPDFIKYNLNGHIDLFKTKTFFRSYGVQNPILIDRCIASDGKPFLPGSSLKGSLRTALLFSWLQSNSNESKKALKIFMDEVDQHYEDHLKSIEDKLSERGNNITKKQKEGIISKEKTKYAGYIESSFTKNIEEKCFGTLKQEDRLVASNLRVNDSLPVENCTGIYQLERYRLDDNDGDNKQVVVLKECIIPHTQFKTRIHIDYYNSERKNIHSLFKPVSRKEDFFALINKWSLQLIQYESGILETINLSGTGLTHYHDFLHDMREAIVGAGIGKAFLRLGFGKMQFYQTIAIPLFASLGSDENNDSWLKYLCYCDGLNYDISDPYPITRTLTRSGQLALGWIELS